jgi:hypothetical protein
MKFIGVPVAIEPFAHGSQFARKIRHAQPYCGCAHANLLVNACDPEIV